MLTCMVCGGVVLNTTGGVFTVMDGWIGLHNKDCHDAFKARFHRLLEDMQMEFAGERVEPHWGLPCLGENISTERPSAP